jgi:predicted GIY-YIG superfamily endonuclease
MSPLGHKYKRCIYSYEFDDKSVYVGLTYNIDKRQHSRNSDKNDQVTKHINKTNKIPIRKILTDYIDVNDAIKMEQKYIKEYMDNGWKILNISKAGGIGSNDIKWIYDKCAIEAKKYITRTEFKINSCGAYYASLKNGWMDEICKHMIEKPLSKPHKYWNFKNCKEEALKYINKKQFKINNASAYNSALRNGWLDDICQHMNLNIKWTYDKCKEEALKYDKKIYFKKCSASAYNSALRNKWIDDICQHMIKNK